MNTTPANRRSSHIEMPVTYAAVGASQSPDLMRFPPEGTTPYERELRLGSGQERFVLAASLLMTWGAQRGGGATVVNVVRGSGSEYTGPTFSDAGAPQVAEAVEEHFAPDGEPYLVAGTTATLQEPEQSDRSILVVAAVNEARRVGFAWGSCDEVAVVGEQFFVVEYREDESVVAVARGFLSTPRSGLLGRKGRADMKQALESVERQLAALAPGAPRLTGPSDSAGPEPVAADPVGAEPDAADPVAAEPDAADPAVAEPIVAEPVASGEAPASTGPVPHQRRPSQPNE